MKLIALWDVDGVLAQTNHAVLKSFQDEGKLLGLTYEDLSCWNWSFQDQVPLEDLWQRYLDLDKTTLGPDPAALRGILACKDLGFEIHVVTGRTPTEQNRQQTWEWLKQVGAPYDVLEFVPAKEKAHYAYERGIALSVEDHRETALALAETGCYSLLVWQPWNALGDRDQPVWRSNFWHIDMEKLPYWVGAAYRAIQLDQIQAHNRKQRVLRGQVVASEGAPA